MSVFAGICVSLPIVTPLWGGSIWRQMDDGDFYIDEAIGRHGSGASSNAPAERDRGSLGLWDFQDPETDDEAERRDMMAKMFNEPPDTPVPILELLTMIARSFWEESGGKAFYEQARRMENYEDDAPIVPFSGIFPTYSGMTTGQLRSYFTVRTTLRHGQFPDVSPGYIMVYACETIMNIGVKTPEEGYEVLKELQDNYPFLRDHKGDFPGWMRDYVVYHNLKSHFREMFPRENEEDELRQVVANYQEADDRSLFDVVCGMSRYGIRRGAAFRREPDVVREAVVAVVRSVVPKIESFTRRDIATLCFGVRSSVPCDMFVRLPYYDSHPVKTARVEVSPGYIYECDWGLWTKTQYIGFVNAGIMWGRILRETDLRLREMLGIGHRLPPVAERGFYEQAADEAVEAWARQRVELQRRREAESRRVRIDFGKLGQIRDDAEAVRDRLLEGTDTEAPAEPAVAPAAAEKPATEPAAQQAAEPREVSFLRLLLEGGDWRQYLRGIHVPEGVMVENINNRAMETIGDIVIEDSGDGLRLIEDYRADVEKLVKGRF